MNDVLVNLWDGSLELGKRILAALLIFIIGRLIISFLNKMVARILQRRKVDAGVQSFVRSLVHILLMVLLVIAVISKLGIETTSFAALLASAGVAVGMALSGNLQNFASSTPSSPRRTTRPSSSPTARPPAAPSSTTAARRRAAWTG